MRHYLVAVINGTTARFLTLEPVEMEGYESGPNLIEHKSLHSVEKEQQGQDLWANVKTGRNRGSAGQAHSYDDHRQAHMIEFEKRFAQSIANRILELIQTHQVRQLILIAEPQILGLMREALNSNLPKNVSLSELAKDLCHHRPREVHDYLANCNLLPAFQSVVS